MILWSPVIITTFIPAVLHFSTATFASSLGGSIIPTIPINIKSFSIVAISSFVGIWSISLYAHPNTLKASFAISSFFSLILFTYSPIFWCISLLISYAEHLFNNSSIPPFVNTIYFPFNSFTVVINFLSESNGISWTLGALSYKLGSKLNLKAISTNAVSVGSPVKVPSCDIFVSLHSIFAYTIFFNSSSISSSCILSMFLIASFQ